MHSGINEDVRVVSGVATFFYLFSRRKELHSEQLF